jgi:hypothetical protein
VDAEDKRMEVHMELSKEMVRTRGKPKNKTGANFCGETNEQTRERGLNYAKKTMELKKKKNLNLMKGNSFSVLQSTTLNKIAADIDIEIGVDNDESDTIINNQSKLRK